MTALSQVLRKIDADEVVELTRALVRIPSVYRPNDPTGTEAQVAAFVESWLRREGFAVEVQPVAPGRPNVIGWLGEKRAGSRSLLLEGHTDVVTEGDPGEWSHPPFGADLVEGRIYGRGTADMKSGLAAAMVAAAAFRRAGVTLRGKLVVGALVDEEDGMIGVRHLCTTPVGRELDAAIICEPEQNELCLEQRGVVWARFRVRGKMAHGAMPEAGVNPIAGLGRLLAAAPGLERRLRRACERSRYLRPPTVTPTIVQGPPPRVGVPQSNVIPAVAETTFDIRLTPGIGADGIRAELETICRDVAEAQPGLKVEWEPVNAFRLATKVERSEALVQAMIRGVKQATRRAARYGGVPGSTDGTILRMELGIPIVTCGPGDRLIPHQVDEFVSADQVVEAANIYAASALNYLEVE
ncbi:MAG TPA: M20 family metallopeptidase [Candidatus Nitrosotalea sp.]|nr:M20 family metallopeptidase [Candidatus Nitrosotalea sp.]